MVSRSARRKDRSSLPSSALAPCQHERLSHDRKQPNKSTCDQHSARSLVLGLARTEVRLRHMQAERTSARATPSS